MTVVTGSTWQVGIGVWGLTDPLIAEGLRQWLLHTFSDMPKLFTMAVAMRVACWKSLEAPAMKGQLFEPIHAPIKVSHYRSVPNTCATATASILFTCTAF